MAETLCLLGKVSFDLKIQRRKFTNEGLAFWVIRKPKFWQIRDTCPIRIAKDCHKFPTKFHTQEKDLTQKKHILHRPGIEPGPPAWQASILPLNQRCLSALSFEK